MAAIAFRVVQRVAAMVDAAALVLEEQAGQAVVQQLLFAEIRQVHALVRKALGQHGFLGGEVEIPEGIQVNVTGILEPWVWMP